MQELIWVIESIRPVDIVDIFIVAIVFWILSFLFRGTQAVALLRGVLILIVGLIVVASIFRLQALGWLLSSGLTVMAFAIPVIFQPELRRALERLGRGSLIFSRNAPEGLRERIIEEICDAAEKLSERRHGALIVLQRNSNLDEYIRTGVDLDSLVNSELLLTVFWPKTELHDGAVIIGSDGRVKSARSVLPLSASRNLPNPNMGTRHRAAMGISEVSDAICVIVSEETGKIAITNGGRMVARLDPERLRTILTAFYGTHEPQKLTILQRIRRWLQPSDLSVPQKPKQKQA